MIQNNKSPMRKLLAKRTINYYDELKKEENRSFKKQE
jgi:hypothetical protein